MDVHLTDSEIAEIDKQHSLMAGDGGFQSLMVSLQKRIDRTAGKLKLTPNDLKRIPRYAFNYHNGGWENRLKSAFGRTHGARLGR